MSNGYPETTSARHLWWLALFICVMGLISGLTSFPLYFFCDEAIHGIDARQILKNGHDSANTFLPLFFKGLGDFPLGLTVYSQVPFVALLGATELAVRVRTVFFAILALYGLRRILRSLGSQEISAVASLMLCLCPFFFLHARTGFEYVPALAGFALLLSGLIGIKAYRPYAIVEMALGLVVTFYSYTPGRGWSLVLLALLFPLFLKRSHKDWRQGFLIFGAVLLCLLPYMLFHHNNPEAAFQRLKSIGGGGILNQLTSLDFLRTVLVRLGESINPEFWFFRSAFPDSPEYIRHTIPGLTQIPGLFSVFSILGIIKLIQERAFFVLYVIGSAFIALAIPAALTSVMIARILPIGFLYVLLAAVGLGWALRDLSARHLNRRFMAAALLCGTSGWYAWFVYDAVALSQFRYQNFGFYGLQYSVRPIFSWIKSQSILGPDIFIGSDLANSSQIYPDFYLPQVQRDRVQIFDSERICFDDRIRPGVYLIISTEAHGRLRSAGCPLELESQRTFLDPHGKQLFNAFLVKDSSQVENWRSAWWSEHRRANVSQIFYRGAPAEISYPVFDMGSPESLFDGDMNSIVRTAQINPATIKLIFTNPREIRGVTIHFSNTHSAEVKTVASLKGAEVAATSGTILSSPTMNQQLELDFGRPVLIDSVSMVLRLSDADERGSVHIAEIELP